MPSKATDEELSFINHLGWEMIVKKDKELLVADNFLLPLSTIYHLKTVESFAREVKRLPIDVVEVRRPTDGSFLALSATADTINDPFEHTHVFAVTGPEKSAVLVLAKPIDVEDTWCYGERALHLDPVPKIVTHVVTAEG